MFRSKAQRMVISSRTPEGSPNQCPVCGSSIRTEPSQPFGDAPCPACGTLLWFLAVKSDHRFFDPREPGLADLVAERLGISADDVRSNRWEELGIDSLDLTQLVMELEDGLE